MINFKLPTISNQSQNFQKIISSCELESARTTLQYILNLVGRWITYLSVSSVFRYSDLIGLGRGISWSPSPTFFSTLLPSFTWSNSDVSLERGVPHEFYASISVASQKWLVLPPWVSSSVGLGLSRSTFQFSRSTLFN
jgi:hypothetical protein